MVYCSKCGTRNDDAATHCTNCGAPLYTVGERYSGSEREYYRRVEHECFGLPNGGAIVGVIFGAIVIILGVSLYLQVTYNINFTQFFWPLVLVIIGLLIVVGAIYGRGRRTRAPA